MLRACNIEREKINIFWADTSLLFSIIEITAYNSLAGYLASKRKNPPKNTYGRTVREMFAKFPYRSATGRWPLVAKSESSTMGDAISSYEFTWAFPSPALTRKKYRSCNLPSILFSLLQSPQGGKKQARNKPSKKRKKIHFVSQTSSNAPT